MKTLSEIYRKHAVGGVNDDQGHGDKGSTHSYIEHYERLLAPFRNSCTFMEIGLAMGKSVAMWDEYFGPEATLVGADVGIAFDTSQFPRWKFVKADATKPGFTRLLGRLKFDVVIDDASHMSQDQVATLDMMRPLMNEGGLYIIEDILNLEQTRHLWRGAEIIDMRSNKGRFDDVLVVYRT